jgi:SpoVK/Ycf46/Vps4 family AAA+-type ATPase
VVTDPDRLFENPGYLMHLLLDDPEEDSQPWRLLVIEDADELLRPDARMRSGAVLSRLLNASDGLIGQGLNVLVLLTTNQPRVVIDPAILRPGRCLAEVAFDRFDRDQAAAWLDDGSRPARPVSLAELYRLRSGGTLDDPTPPPGQYL